MNPVIQRLGLRDYASVYADMRRFTATRDAHTPDELWLVQHAPVYTLGQAGKTEHLLRANGIALEQSDRGGQITYHGPGQIIVYTLLDLRARGLNIRQTVSLLEAAVIDLLAAQDIRGERRSGAPGVYVDGAKIAALGLRVRGGCCYHGIALNVNMDLAPFADINPCGYADLPVTQLTNLRADLGVAMDCATAGEALAVRIAAQLERQEAAPAAQLA